jgi:hypothetical protein
MSPRWVESRRLLHGCRAAIITCRLIATGNERGCQQPLAKSLCNKCSLRISTERRATSDDRERLKDVGIGSPYKRKFTGISKSFFHGYEVQSELVQNYSKHHETSLRPLGDTKTGTNARPTRSSRAETAPRAFYPKVVNTIPQSALSSRTSRRCQALS